MTNFFRILSIALTAGTLAACSFTVPAKSTKTNSDRSQIINGTEIGENELIAHSIVNIRLPSGNFCTGVLLNDHVVLTAAHCMKPGMVGMSVVASHASPSCFAGIIREVSVAPKLPGNTFAPDLALLKLDRALCPVAPTALVANIKTNTVIIGAGFGKGSTSAQAETMTMKVVSSDKEYLKALYLNDFPNDAQVLEDWNFVESNFAEFSEMYLFALAKNSEQSLCFGDSGGPVYREKDGALYIFGVVGGGFPHSKNGVPGCQNTYLQLFAPLGPSMGWLQTQLNKW